MLFFRCAPKNPNSARSYYQADLKSWRLMARVTTTKNGTLSSKAPADFSSLISSFSVFVGGVCVSQATNDYGNENGSNPNEIQTGFNDSKRNSNGFQRFQTIPNEIQTIPNDSKRNSNDSKRFQTKFKRIQTNTQSGELNATHMYIIRTRGYSMCTTPMQ